MPKTIDVDVSRTIAASPEAVWAVLADLNRLPEWLEFAAAVDAVSGPAEPGAMYAVKPHKSYEPTTHWQVAEAQAPVRQLHTSEMPVISGVRSELQLTPSDDGVTSSRPQDRHAEGRGGEGDERNDAETHHSELAALAGEARGRRASVLSCPPATVVEAGGRGAPHQELSASLRPPGGSGAAGRQPGHDRQVDRPCGSDARGGMT